MKDEKYLLIQEAKKEWSGKWFLPGGQVKEGETPETAAHREVREEAGCDVLLHGIFYLKYSKKTFTDQLAVFYAASLVGEEILKQQPDKHSLTVKWFGPEEIEHLSYRDNLARIMKLYDKNKLIPVANFTIKE
jgi:ADP-ribose pyrophosphatase YjhB (NUDIX family)